MLIEKMRQFICGLEGHQMVRHFEPNRMALKCPCGYETHGWEIRERTRPESQVEYVAATELSGEMCSAR